MNTDREREVERICQAALDREPDTRGAFVAEACRGDEELRHEVESLLAYAAASRSFIETPALEDAARQLANSEYIVAGQRIGSYQVLSQIGAGGMGTVYRAHDTELGRDVAIKVLPTAFLADRDREARFAREARILAALNHPHIAAIHGVEEVNGARALILEFVEGPTLAERIADRPVPVDEALRIATQITEALEAAHGKGIVHRDLKPANIKLTHGGTVKVLDFGLAKTVTGSVRKTTVDNSPTFDLTAPHQGVILGTAAYMAPEQAKGLATDRRADIWAFGCVLYEMVTGRQVFGADDVSTTLARVLDRAPDFTAVSDAVHPKLHDVLNRCLQKDPGRRYHDIADVRLDLESVMADPSGVAVSEAARSSSELRDAGRWRAISPATSFAAGGLLIGLAVWGLSFSGLGLSAPPDAQPVRRLSVTLPTAAAFSARGDGDLLTLSPDGRVLVYLGADDRLYQHSMDEGEATPILGTEGARNPFFAIDGRWVGFSKRPPGSVARTSMKVSLDGAPPVALCGTAGPGAVPQASWVRDDTIFQAGSGGGNDGLFRTWVDGGPEGGCRSETLSDLPAQSPSALPQGQGVLFTLVQEPLRVAVYDLSSGAVRVVVDGSTPHFAAGHIVFARQNSLWAVPFDADQLELSGDPVRVVERVALNEADRAQFAVAADGTIVYLPEGSVSPARLTALWVDRDGRGTPLRMEPGGYAHPRVAPDGTRVVLNVGGAGVWDTWVHDVERGTLGPFTTGFEDQYDGLPLWTPDGTRVTFSGVSDRAADLFWQVADRSDTAQRLLARPGPQWPSSWSPDGAHLAFDEARRGTGLDIWIYSLVEETAAPFLVTDAQEEDPMFSPDGRWISYTSDQSGQPEIYVTSYPGPGATFQVSDSGGVASRWSPDGRELLYMTDAGQLVAVAVEAEPALRLGISQVLFQDPNYVPEWDVHPDGVRFLMLRQGSQPSTRTGSRTEIGVLLNGLPRP